MADGGSADLGRLGLYSMKCSEGGIVQVSKILFVLLHKLPRKKKRKKLRQLGQVTASNLLLQYRYILCT